MQIQQVRIKGKTSAAAIAAVVQNPVVKSQQHFATECVAKGAVHGLLGVKGILFAARKDGSAWAYDVANKRLVLDAPMDLSAHITPMVLDDDRIILGLDGGCIGVVPVPRLP